jgi:hypothetical protein
VKQLLQSSGGIFMKNISLLFIVISLFGLSVFAQKDKKIDIKEVIEKHLEAIGTAEKRALNRTIAGDTEFKPKVVFSPMPAMKGKNVIASDNQNVLFLMAFSEKVYPAEQFAFDGKVLSHLSFNYKTISILQGQEGLYSISPLTILASQFPELLNKGLLGGTLTTAWCLQHLQEKGKLRIENNSKKVDGHEAFIISFTPAKMYFTSIKLFIDNTSFQHFRTEYKKELRGSTPVLDNPGFSGIDEVMVEKFSDFKTESGLLLPHTYQIDVDIPYGKLVSYEWKTTFSTFLFDQKMNEELFRIKAK